MGARLLYGFGLPAVADLALSFFGLVLLPAGAAPAPTETGSGGPIFKALPEVQWVKMLPELGDASPEMANLHEDAKTHATQLMIRAPKLIHIRKH